MLSKNCTYFFSIDGVINEFIFYRVVLLLFHAVASHAHYLRCSISVKEKGVSIEVIARKGLGSVFRNTMLYEGIRRTCVVLIPC